MKQEAKQQFVSESIIPITATADTRAMAMGEPGLPTEFKWKQTKLEIAKVTRTWKETGPCSSHGGGEMYVKKHWYEVTTALHGKAQIYFERQARGRNKKERWWLYSIEETA